VVNRVRGPFNVGTPAQVAGIAALEDVDHQERSRAHNDLWLPWLAAGIGALGLSVHPSAGNFLLIELEREGPRTAAAASAHLEAVGILARPMAAYGLPQCLRLSVGREAENRAAVDALREFTA
jgi:histidinol-phosphate aminotransferase